MKLLFGILMLFLFSNNSGLMTLKEKLEKTPVSVLPFEANKKTPWGKSAFAVGKNEWQNLPIFTYADLGMTKHNDYEEDVVIFRKFDSEYKNYCIVALEIGVSEPVKQLLVTFDNKGEVLDFLETGVYWGSENRLCVKQWRINNKHEVIISWIKILSDDLFKFYDDFSFIKGQRMDICYNIDENGKFRKVKEMLFAPITYTKTYLEGEKNLWEGGEMPIEE